MANGNGLSTSPTLLRELANPRNNEAAWRTFLERYKPLIHGWCCRCGLNHDQAEEVTEAVLGKLVTAMRTFVYDPTRQFRGWLRTVVHNEVRSLWRQERRHPGDRGSGDPAVHRVLEQVEAGGGVDDLARELDEALGGDVEWAWRVAERVRARVEEPTWRAYEQTALADRAAEDVAGELHMTVAAVYAAKWRVKKLLREEGAKLRGQAEGG